MGQPDAHKGPGSARGQKRKNPSLLVSDRQWPPFTHAIKSDASSWHAPHTRHPRSLCSSSGSQLLLPWGPFLLFPCLELLPPSLPAHSPFFTFFSQASAVTPFPDHPLSDSPFPHPHAPRPLPAFFTALFPVSTYSIYLCAACLTASPTGSSACRTRTVSCSLGPRARGIVWRTGGLSKYWMNE